MPGEDEQSLATLLNMEQRGDLNLLIANTTEEMRKSIAQTFEVTNSSRTPASEPHSESGVQDKTGDHSGKTLARPSAEDLEHARKEREQLAQILSAPRIQEMKAAALSFFDTWRDSVIIRVGEVINSRDHQHKEKDTGHVQKVAEKSDPKTATETSSKHRAAIDRAVAKIYPPLPTPLAKLSENERVTIVNAMLLLLLSLEKYSAHSRTFLIRLASSLHISATLVTKMETDIAHGLLVAAEKMDGSSSAEAAQKANASSRKWKVGLASVAGAALIGVTGGLAAPLVAAGVGGLMGGLGLGATAAAGYLGALAGSGALVGGLFGAYGGRMTGRMMDEYAREVEDFRFVEVTKGRANWREKFGRADEAKEKEKRRLRVTVGISGWLTEEKQVTDPWLALGDGGEPFALRWELKALLALGNAITNFIKSKAWGYIKKELIARTILAGLWSALMLPFAAVQTASKILDSPWSIAKSRADKAGKVLAHAIINKAQGERPISLIGYSLGARVIYHCLLSLAEQKAFGLVDSVVLMGAATPSDEQSWRALRSVVSGRLVNVYSESDYILAFLYRTSSVQLGIAGLQAVEGVPGVENVDMTESINGHLKYSLSVGPVLARVGWVDVDEEVLAFEEKALDKIAQEEKEADQAGEGVADEKNLQEEAAMFEKQPQHQPASPSSNRGPGSHFASHRQAEHM